ncbi:MAG TPA: Rv3235 family protein [Mycobacteriales bacterium]|nr:Rv3235 family protein [Mycobacteriales bacterium]
MTAAPVEPYAPPRLRVTARRIPDCEPEYDDGPRHPVIRGSLALAPYAPRGAAPALRLVPEPDVEDDGAFDPVRTPREDLEDPRPRAAILVRAVLETLAGTRPVGQLMRWTSADVFAELEPLVAAHRSTPWVVTLRRVLVSEPVPGVAEVSAVVQRGARAGALALRLEGVDGRWLVTALQLG